MLVGPITFPDNVGPHWFRVEYEWEERPESGNGWDDPGSGGIIYFTEIEWLDGFRPTLGGLTVHKCLWDMKWFGDDKSLAERLESDALTQAHEDYYNDGPDDYYNPDEWYYWEDPAEMGA